MTKINLKDLVGKHLLCGVDTCIEDKVVDEGLRYSKRNLTDGICFILDNVKYQVYSDEADGYRSYLSEVFSDQSCCCQNTFTPLEVLVIWKTPEQNAICILNNSTGKLILEVGTDYTYDYYPCAIAYFNPRAIGNLDENK